MMQSYLPKFKITSLLCIFFFFFFSIFMTFRNCFALLFILFYFFIEFFWISTLKLLKFGFKSFYCCKEKFVWQSCLLEDNSALHKFRNYKIQLLKLIFFQFNRVCLIYLNKYLPNMCTTDTKLCFFFLSICIFSGVHCILSQQKNILNAIINIFCMLCYIFYQMYIL